jgi:hypothetical protein
VLVLMLLLLPLDDHLLQLGLLQHIRQLIVVIKVNHGMLRKKMRRKYLTVKNFKCVQTRQRSAMM